MLIGIAFAGIYGGINEAEPTGFFAQQIEPNNVDFLYFSFVTITTVGYGDLTAGTEHRACARRRSKRSSGRSSSSTLVARLVACTATSNDPPATVPPSSATRAN